MALFGLLGGKKTSVGLDIGSGIIKLAVIDHSGSEPELIKVATTEVAADAIVEGEVVDPGIVSEAIRGLFSAAGVKQRSVVTAVGGRDVIVKKIQMDRMKEGDAREVIRWEAEQHVPFDMANVELDFQILDPDAEGLQMNVLLVAAKRELVDSRTSLLSEAGLEAGIIDVDAFAIHNAFELNHPDAMQGVVGLVNIGHEVTNVSTGTPSSRMFTLVTSCPMLTSPTTPCMASGWFSSKALWIANASTSMIPGSSPASLRSEVRLSTSSRFAATSSTFICSPSASGSRIWKSSSTFAMSNGTCCSASHRITSRASPSFIRSIWIFLTITSRPPTAVTTVRCLTPAVEKSPRIASDTSPGSMTSPSTMASAATSVVATLMSSGSLPE